MDYLWQLRSLDIDSEPQSGSHEQQELQVRRPNTGLQADDHRKRVEDALAINRHDLPEYPERHFEKQKASVHHAVVYDRQETLRLDWDGHHDPMNPRNMRKFRKWVTVIVCSMTALLIGSSSSMYFTTYDQITAEFHCSRKMATLGLSLFIFAQGTGPLILAPLTEVYGRQVIYRVSIVFVFVFLIPCAFAPNIQTLLIARFFGGLSGSAFIGIVGATIGDLFTGDSLETPMMIYTLSHMSAPQLGPLIGGFINQHTHWRWTFYVLMIWASFCVVSVFFLVPETYHPIVLRAKARNLRKSTGEMRWRAPIELEAETGFNLSARIGSSILRPFQLLIFEPMVLNLCILTALVLGTIYLFFGAFGLIFPQNYGFNLEQVGMSFQGLLVGQLAGILTRPFWRWYTPRLIAKKNPNLQIYDDKQRNPVSEPEYRLLPAIFGAVSASVGLFWFAGTTIPSIHWIVPIIGSGVFGLGSALIYNGVFTYLVEAYPDCSASALAANGFVRSSFAAAFPFFGIQMYEKLGFQWASTVLAIAMAVMAPFPYIFYRFGKRFRKASRYATADKDSPYTSSHSSEIRLA